MVWDIVDADSKNTSGRTWSKMTNWGAPGSPSHMGISNKQLKTGQCNFVKAQKISQRFAADKWELNQESATFRVVGNFVAFVLTLAPPLPSRAWGTLMEAAVSQFHCTSWESVVSLICSVLTSLGAARLIFMSHSSEPTDQISGWEKTLDVKGTFSENCKRATDPEIPGARDYWLGNTGEQLKPQEEAGMKILRKSRHLKAAVYTREAHT